VNPPGRHSMALNQRRFDSFSYEKMTSRNAGFVTSTEQQRLLRGGVFVCGVGGMGGAAASALVRAGVGRLAIADPDRFETSNLNRQPFATVSTLGEPKSDVTVDALTEINPTLDVLDLGANWESSLERTLREYPVVVNAMDDTRAGIGLYRVAREMGATVIDAYSAPLPSVTVVRPEDPRPEERLRYPTANRLIDEITEEDLATARELEAEFVLAHSSAIERFDVGVAVEILSGKRARSSFSTVVTIAGTLMAHEALSILLGRRSGADAAGYFFDPWSGRIERPQRGIGGWLRRRIARRFITEAMDGSRRAVR
jgi:molybdopterin-synthase adenylyltransferase